MTSTFEVVISGISGRFPECDDVHTLQHKLYNLENFITTDSRKWPLEYKYKLEQGNIPCSTGKYTNDSVYDHIVFKFTNKFSNSTDAIIRKGLEPSFEAIVDAGINPYSLCGNNIGVFATTGFNEMDSTVTNEIPDPSLLLLMGSSKTMQSNRISFTFHFTGPSFTFHADSMGSLYALSTAYRLISEGSIEAAIVVVASHILDPKLSLQYMALDLLSPDGLCRAFDRSANGFGRSEATVTLFLQRAEDAKRSYGSIVTCDTYYHGDSNTTFLGYNEYTLKDFLRPIYVRDGCKNILNELSFIELGSCGNKRRDAIEANAIADVICNMNKKPILVGSVTSNVGHTEASFAYMSLLKAIFALNNGAIPPNANFFEQNNNIRALKNKTLQVVNEKTELTGSVVGVNAMGLTANFGHVILQQNLRAAQTDESNDTPCKLLLICGRTEDGLQNAIKKIEEMPYNPEFISLANEVFTMDMPFHVYRGYTVLPKTINTQSNVGERGDNTRPLWFVFSGMGSQWNGMGHGLLDIPVFAEVVKKCNQILKPKGIDIYHILTSDDPKIFDNIVHSFVGIITVQIGLFEVLKTLKIYPDGIIGHSVGENACAYADNCLTLEQTVLASYERGKASIDTETITGMMAAVGKGYHEIKDSLPDDVMVACHNSTQSCTLSGPADTVNKFVEELKKNGVFARSVNVANIAYHSKYITPAAPQLLSSLKKVITDPRKRSSKWISTSIPELEWQKPLAQYCSAEYLTNNLLSPVLFEEGCKYIPANAVLIEIAPHGLLQAILKRSLPSTCLNIPLTLRSRMKSNMSFLLSAIGRLYIAGYQPDINEIFPKISYPVHKSTPSISPFCTWQKYEGEYDRKIYKRIPEPPKSAEVIPILINEDAEYNYLINHKMEGQNVIPTAFLMYLVWNALSERKNEKLGKYSIVFENLVVHRNLKISITKPRFVSIMIQPTGNFELLLQNKKYPERTVVIISGIIYTPFNDTELHAPQETPKTLEVQLSKQQIYDDFKKNGYQLENGFASIEHMSSSNTVRAGGIRWTENWATFLDSLMKFHMFSTIKNTSKLLCPSFIEKLSICSHQFTTIPKGTIIPCHENLRTGVLLGEGVCLRGVEYNSWPPPAKLEKLQMKAYDFVSYNDPRCQTSEEFVELCLHIAVENMQTNSDRTELCIIQTPEIRSRTIADILKRNESLKVKAKLHDMPRNDVEMPRFENKCLLLLTPCRPACDVSESTDLEYTFLLVVDTSVDYPDEILNLYSPITKQKFLDLTYCLLKRKAAINLPVVENGNNKKKNWEPVNTLKSQPSVIIQSNIHTIYLPIIISERKMRDRNRYLFLLDSSTKSEKYVSLVESRIAQDLSVSVLRRGEWGFYRHISYKPPNSPSSGISPADIEMKSVNVQYLCLHQETNDPQIPEESSYGIEYAGIHTSGSRIMGLASMKVPKLISEADPILMWQIPDNWSLEHAATLPFVYAQAYYISQLWIARIPPQSALINMGQSSSLAEACITIWQHQGLSIYVSVSSVSQAALIRKKFPKLESFRILDQDKCAYEQQIILLRKGQGVDIVLNCASGMDHINASLNCLGSTSYYIELAGNGNCSRLNNMYLSAFLKTISFIILPDTVSKLLTLSEDIKRRIKIDVQGGIGQGLVTPFTNLHSLEECPEYELGNTGVKKVYCHSSESELKIKNNQKLHLDGNHSYIIIAQRARGEWFQVLEWLLSKGALNIVVALDNFTLGVRLSSRLNRVIKQRNCKIMFVSSRDADTINGATKIITDADRIASLEALFFVSLDNCGRKLEYMDTASRKINPNMHFISLFSGGLRECELRRYEGLPALVIHGENYHNKMQSILSEVFSLLTSSDHCNMPPLFEIRAADCEVPSESRESMATLREFLPRDIEVLEEIGRHITKKPRFLEISTSSPRYSDTRGVYPIFIIPATDVDKLQPILQKLAYPAFCATMSDSVHTMEDMLRELYASLNKIQPTGPVTLVSETWNANLAMQLSTKLQDNERPYKLFLLEANHIQWRNRIKNLGCDGSHEFDVNLMKQMFHFDSQINTKITDSGRNSSFSEQVECYLSTTSLNADQRSFIIKAAMMIRKQILLASQRTSSTENVLLKHVTFFERYTSKEFPLNLSKTSKIKVIGEDSYDTFVAHPTISDSINKEAAFSWWDYTKVDEL